MSPSAVIDRAERIVHDDECPVCRIGLKKIKSRPGYYICVEGCGLGWNKTVYPPLREKALDIPKTAIRN